MLMMMMMMMMMDCALREVDEGRKKLKRRLGPRFTQTPRIRLLQT
jgi:hypothetical protein